MNTFANELLYIKENSVYIHHNPFHKQLFQLFFIMDFQILSIYFTIFLLGMASIIYEIIANRKFANLQIEVKYLSMLN